MLEPASGVGGRSVARETGASGPLRPDRPAHGNWCAKGGSGRPGTGPRSAAQLGRDARAIGRRLSSACQQRVDLGRAGA